MQSGIKDISYIPSGSLTKLQYILLRSGMTVRSLPEPTEVTLEGAAVMTVTQETAGGQAASTELTLHTEDPVPEACVWLVTDSEGQRWVIAPPLPHTGTVTKTRSTSGPKSDPVVTTVKIKTPCAPTLARTIGFR